MELQDALAKVAPFVGAPGKITIEDDDGWEILIFDWTQLTSEEVGEFIEDVLGDEFQEDGGELYVDGYTDWVSESYVPFAVIGPEGTAASTVSEFAQVDRVLFLHTDTPEGAVHVGGPDEVDIAGNVFAERIEDLLPQLS